MGGLMTIELKQLRFFAFHGLYEEEKRGGNDFEVNLSVLFHPPVDIIHTIKETVNYAELYELLNEEMQQPRELLETLVMEIAQKIHTRFPPVTKISISVLKLHPPIPGIKGSTGVTYEKEW